MEPILELVAYTYFGSHILVGMMSMIVGLIALAGVSEMPPGSGPSFRTKVHLCAFLILSSMINCYGTFVVFEQPFNRWVWVGSLVLTAGWFYTARHLSQPEY